MSLAVFLLAWQGVFAFSGVQPRRWSEGRQERSPAFSAVLDNRSGQDLAEGRFLVRVHCAEGGTRAYTIVLRDLLRGPQGVEVTAYNSIGAVQACDGAVEVMSLGATPYDAAASPAFALFGCSVQEGGGARSSDLEGILDY